MSLPSPQLVPKSPPSPFKLDLKWLNHCKVRCSGSASVNLDVSDPLSGRIRLFPMWSVWKLSAQVRMAKVFETPAKYVYAV